MQGLLRDVRHSARVLRRAPVLTLTAIVTIGIGAGANATVASFIDALLFRTPAGMRDPSQLVSIDSADFSSGPYGGTSTPDYVSMTAETSAFSGIAASRDDPGVILSAGANVERVSRSEVTANFFDVIGLRPALGRFFSTVDEAPGAAPTAIVGSALSKRLFQAAASPLGAPVTFAGTTYTIIGVAPEGFEALDLSRPREILDAASASLAGSCTARQPWPHGHRSTRAGCRSSASAARARRPCRTAGPRLPLHQPGNAAESRSSARLHADALRARWRTFPLAGDRDRRHFHSRIDAGAGDCRGQCRQPVAGALGRAAARACHPRGDRCESWHAS